MPDLEVTCPAGEKTGAVGHNCFCRVERHLLLQTEEPTSLAAYCFGTYTACPTWTREKNRIWEADRTPLAEG